MNQNDYIRHPNGRLKTIAERRGIVKASQPVKHSVTADERAKLRKSEELGRRFGSTADVEPNPWTRIIAETGRRHGRQNSSPQIKRWRREEKIWNAENRAKLELEKQAQDRQDDPAYQNALADLAIFERQAERWGVPAEDVAFARGLIQGGNVPAYFEHRAECNAKAMDAAEQKKNKLLADAAPATVALAAQNAIIGEMQNGV